MGLKRREWAPIAATASQQSHAQAVRAPLARASHAPVGSHIAEPRPAAAGFELGFAGCPPYAFGPPVGTQRPDSRIMLG